MGDNGVDVSRGSFTVEATFVVTISMWIVLMVCYIAMYAHDEVALYSLSHNYLEMTFENEADPQEDRVAQGLSQYLQRHLVIGRVRDVSVKNKLLSVEAEFTYEVSVSVAFIKKMMTGKEGITLKMSREKFEPAKRMWDCEIIEN